jgi:hypothetical protein
MLAGEKYISVFYKNGDNTPHPFPWPELPTTWKWVGGGTDLRTGIKDVEFRGNNENFTEARTILEEKFKEWRIDGIVNEYKF